MKLYFKKRKRLLKHFLVGISLFLLGALGIFLLSFLPRNFFGVKWFSHPLFPVFLMTLISIAAYKPLDFFCTEFFKHFLFKRKSFIHLSLIRLAEELRLVLDLQELANLVVNTFGEVLHLKTVAMVIPNLARESFEIARTGRHRGIFSHGKCSGTFHPLQGDPSGSGRKLCLGE